MQLYTVEFEGESITNANGDHELFELDSATARPIEVYAYEFEVTSEVGEAQEEWLRCKTIRGHATDGTGGTSKTPRPVADSAGIAAAGFTGDVCRTGIASTGTPITLHSFAINVRTGYSWGPVPEGYGWGLADPASLLVVRLTTAVADDVTMTGTIWVREYP